MSTVSSPIYFNGMSTFASSLNTQISHALQMASQPTQLLDNDAITLTNQSAELQTLNTDFTSVQSAISGLASAAGNMLTASVSNSSVATATLGSGAAVGTYTLGVSVLGSPSDALSIDGLPTVSDPSSQNISASGSYTLSVNGATPPITISATNLDGLAQAINTADGGVQATVVNVGTNSAPDYRLSLQSNQLGNVTMQLNDSTTGEALMVASATPGTLTQYTINGQPVSSDSDTVTLSPGLTVNLTGLTTTNPAIITVAPNSSSIANALQSFVSAYNSAITEVGKNIGQGGGALAGESIVYQLTNALQGLATYSGGSGGISSMSDLGVTYEDTTGQLTFNQNTFASATSGQTDALTAFLGSATDGGFLETATNVMNGIEAPTTGILTNGITSIQSNITSTNAQIANDQVALTQLQTNLTQQMAAVDAMLYSMQQQATQVQAILTAQQASQMAGLG